MENILTKIKKYKQEELEHVRRKKSQADLIKKTRDVEPAQKVVHLFQQEGIHLIAEIKKASPSLGVIRADFVPTDIARIYEDNGVKVISVLTDEKFFQGSLQYLEDVRAAVKIPLLRKDFTISEYHIYEARAAKADVVLLIAAMLDAVQLKDFQDLTQELGMTALVEVHDAEEMEVALHHRPQLLGINNRNLKTFEISVETTLTLMRHFKNGNLPPIISESGLKDHQTLLRLQQAGASGFLIGESFMKAENIAQKVKSFMNGVES